MTTANRENSKELYHLTGWGNRAGDIRIDHWHYDTDADRVLGLCPAYDLEFLRQQLIRLAVPRAEAERVLYEGPDAACLLLIEVLNRDPVSAEHSIS